MRSGRIATLAASALLLIAAGVRGERTSLVLDGEPIRLEAPVVLDGASLLVPLDEFGRLIGIEAGEGPQGTTSLRCRTGRRNAEPETLPIVDGIAYASLEWLAALAGATVRDLAGATYVDSNPVPMRELDVSEQRVVLRFDAFVPVEVLAIEADSIRLRVHHCTLPFAHRSFVLAGGPMERLEAQATGIGALDLTVTLREVGALRMRRFEADGFYSVTVEIGAEARIEAVSEIHEGVRLHELDLSFALGPAILAYIRVEDWRMGYRVRPSAASWGLGDLTSLARMAADRGAAAGIAVGAEPALLVIDGVPRNVPPGEVDVLTIDPFGRLAAGRTSGAAALCAEGLEIPIDGVNRPMCYGEAVAYPPGYDGEIAEGVPGALSVLKLRGDRVVTVYRGTFVDRDPTATLVVASGEACARFAGVPLGAKARLVCLAAGIADGDETLTHAVTIDGVLIHDGVDVSPADGVRGAQAWSLLAVDWHGGLILLSIVRDDRSAGATLGEVRSFLRTLETPIRDAYVLDASGSSALVVFDDGYDEVGGGDRTAVGLLLEPISE